MSDFEIALNNTITEWDCLVEGDLVFRFNVRFEYLAEEDSLPCMEFTLYSDAKQIGIVALEWSSLSSDSNPCVYMDICKKDFSASCFNAMTRFIEMVNDLSNELPLDIAKKFKVVNADS